MMNLNEKGEVSCPINVDCILYNRMMMAVLPALRTVINNTSHRPWPHR